MKRSRLDMASQTAWPTRSTRFVVGDIVLCEHDASEWCGQCCNRQVQQVPNELFEDFCQAFPRTRLGQGGAIQQELTFASSAALLAQVSMTPGSCFLHVGSGTGRTLVACALMFPGCRAVGLESRNASHQEGLASVLRLPENVRRNVHLHQCDPVQCQWDWQQATRANVVCVSCAGLTNETMSQVAQALQGTAPSTKVISLSKSLGVAGLGTAPYGFQVLGETHLRCFSGNMLVCVYVKV